MRIDFSTEYSQRSDDELLHLASQRHSLATDAAVALDAELHRRSLTESDRIEHERFVKRQEQSEIESRKQNRIAFAPFRYLLSWRDLLWAFGIIALISFTYLALPRRYHMGSEWQDAAFIVMITSILVAVSSQSIFRRRIVFWISLVISSAIHLFVVHAITQKVGNLNRGAGKGAAVFGFLLFFGVYKFGLFLQRIFRSDESQVTVVNARPFSS